MTFKVFTSSSWSILSKLKDEMKNERIGNIGEFTIFLYLIAKEENSTQRKRGGVFLSQA